MRRVDSIGIAGCTIRKPHQPREGVPQTVRREIIAHSDVDQARNRSLKRANLPRGPRFVCLCCVLFPAESEDMNEHLTDGLACRDFEI